MNSITRTSSAKFTLPRTLRHTIPVVYLLTASWATAQNTWTWDGGSTGSPNASATDNWDPNVAPSANSNYHFIFNLANLTNAATNRVAVSWNVANVGLLSLELTGGSVQPVNSTGTNFTWSGSTDLALRGGITVNSGDHTFNTTATVASNATWNIAAGSSLGRSANSTFTMASDRTITKTGAGTMAFSGANTGIAGTLEVQEGVLRVSTSDNALGNATVALNGGELEILSNNTRNNTGATTTVIGESTLRLSRAGGGAGVSHGMGALQLGSSKLTVTANDQNTSGTANVTFGATTLSNNATLEVVNGTAAATRVTLGAVGETGGSRGLTKVGNGQLLLDAANTYSGSTVVSGGSLILGAAGSISSSSVLDVASGATLDVSAVSGGFVVGSNQALRGSGTVVGNTTVNGALQPGNSAGLLSFNNDLALGSTASTTMEINGTDVRGTDFDAIDVVSGLLTYDGALTLTMGTTFGFGSYSFNLFEFGSTSGSFDSVDLGGSYSGALINNGFGVWGLTSGNDTWSFTESTGLLALEVVPEPSTYALLALAAAGLGARMIRRRQRGH